MTAEQMKRKANGWELLKFGLIEEMKKKRKIEKKYDKDNEVRWEKVPLLNNIRIQFVMSFSSSPWKSSDCQVEYEIERFLFSCLATLPDRFVFATSKWWKCASVYKSFNVKVCSRAIVGHFSVFGWWLYIIYGFELEKWFGCVSLDELFIALLINGFNSRMKWL